LDLEKVKAVIDFAVGETKPDLTLFVHVPPEVSAERLRSRQATLPLELQRDRFEEADRQFFDRVAKGYEAIAGSEPGRVKFINGVQPVEAVCARIWEVVAPVLPKVGRW
jgi:dTMP kinase